MLYMTSIDDVISLNNKYVSGKQVLDNTDRDAIELGNISRNIYGFVTPGFVWIISVFLVETGRSKARGANMQNIDTISQYQTTKC